MIELVIMSKTQTDITFQPSSVDTIDPEIYGYVQDLVGIVDQPLLETSPISEGSAEGLDSLMSAAAELARIALLDEASRTLIRELAEAEGGPIKEDLDTLVEEAETYVGMGYAEEDSESAKGVLEDLTKDFISTWARRTASQYTGPIERKDKVSETSQDSERPIDAVEGEKKNSQRAPTMNSAQVTNRLKALGFFPVSGGKGGSHIKFEHADGRRTVFPTGHSGDVKRLTLKSALERAGIPEDVFYGDQ